MYPPAKIALPALLEGPIPDPLLLDVRSPKSTAFPVDEKVINCIVFEAGTPLR